MLKILSRSAGLWKPQKQLGRYLSNADPVLTDQAPAGSVSNDVPDPEHKEQASLGGNAAPASAENARDELKAGSQEQPFEGGNAAPASAENTGDELKAASQEQASVGGNAAPASAENTGDELKAASPADKGEGEKSEASKSDNGGTSGDGKNLSYKLPGDPDGKIDYTLPWQDVSHKVRANFKELPRLDARTEVDKKERDRQRLLYQSHRRKYNKQRYILLGINPNEEMDVEQALDELLGRKGDVFKLGTLQIKYQLKIDNSKSNQQIRAAVRMPHGPLAVSTIGVFARPELEEELLAAGANRVGGDDLVERILDYKRRSDDCFEKGKHPMGRVPFPFSRVLAEKSMMPKLSKIARILGPLGHMPNPKFGTMTDDLVPAVKEWRHNKYLFKSNSHGTISMLLGRTHILTRDQLLENIAASGMAVFEMKPSVIKGKFVMRVTLSVKDQPVEISKESLNRLMARMAAEQKQFMVSGVIAARS